jgi:hypothetical protein
MGMDSLKRYEDLQSLVVPYDAGALALKQVDKTLNRSADM